MGSRDSSTQISSISPSPGKIKPHWHRRGIRALPAPALHNTGRQASILASEWPPQHHEVEFDLTHKAESPIVWLQKRELYHLSYYLTNRKDAPIVTATLNYHEITTMHDFIDWPPAS